MEWKASKARRRIGEDLVIDVGVRDLRKGVLHLGHEDQHKAQGRRQPGKTPFNVLFQVKLTSYLYKY